MTAELDKLAILGGRVLHLPRTSLAGYVLTHDRRLPYPQPQLGGPGIPRCGMATYSREIVWRADYPDLPICGTCAKRKP